MILVWLTSPHPQCLALSTLFLLWSSCGTSHYLPKLESLSLAIFDNKQWHAYKSAMAFRFSHYYVSFLSEATVLIVGIGRVVGEDNGAAAADKKSVGNFLEY